MKARMKIDLSEKIRKGDAPPKGQEARYVRAGLAEEVKAAPDKPAAKRKRAKAKPKVAPAPVQAPATSEV